jgi:hypothetical protein
MTTAILFEGSINNPDPHSHRYKVENTGLTAYTLREGLEYSCKPCFITFRWVFTEMKTFFVTGGAGFIGGNFILNLMKTGQAKEFPLSTRFNR